VAGRQRLRLTDAAIARLRPRGREYTVWDSRMPGLGVRVRPSGGRSFVLLHDAGGRTRRVSLGAVSTMSIAEARRECFARRANPEPETGTEPTRPDMPFRDFVEGPWREAHFDRYKSSTKRTAGVVLARWILPAFGSTALHDITPARVRHWFDAYSRTAPGGANRGLDVFRQIMNFAMACGHIDANPARDVRKNRRRTLTRFLSREEIGRLHEVLDRHALDGRQQQADIVRLLLLTGCRRGEIVPLQWSEVEEHKLVLRDSKTGPRSVPLNTKARSILQRQPRGASPFVFPSPLDAAKPRNPDLRFWYRVRREAGIEDVRLHDLRHTHASHAVMNGVPVPVVSRLLGHSNVRMTLRYAHLEDREIEKAAERVGQYIAAIMRM